MFDYKTGKQKLMKLKQLKKKQQMADLKQK